MRHQWNMRGLLLLSVLLVGIVALPRVVAAPHTAGGTPGAPDPLQRPTIAPEPTSGPARPELCQRPPRGAGAPAACIRSNPNIYVRLLVQPGGTIPQGAVATYQLVATNLGRADARAVELALPFPAQWQSLRSARFSDPEAWVRSATPGMVEVRLNALLAGQTITSTLELATSSTAPLDSALAARATIGWTHGSTSISRLSNQVPLLVGSAAAAGVPARLTIEPAAGASGKIFDVRAAGFASDEGISLWYHHPDGTVRGLAGARASNQGSMVYQFEGTNLRAGTYTLVATGQFSRAASVGTVTIP